MSGGTKRWSRVRAHSIRTLENNNSEVQFTITEVKKQTLLFKDKMQAIFEFWRMRINLRAYHIQTLAANTSHYLIITAMIYKPGRSGLPYLHYIRHQRSYEHMIQLNIFVFQNILQNRMFVGYQETK